MHESPRIRRLRNDLAALDRLRSESSVFQFQATGSPPHHYQIMFKGKRLMARHGKVKVARHASGRDQAGGLLSPDDSRDPLAHADLPSQYLRDRHGLPWGLRNPLGAERPARRAVHDALGHGPLSQLRHSQPLQPRCRALGGQPDVDPVPDRSPAAPRPAGGAGANRTARPPMATGNSAEPATEWPAQARQSRPATVEEDGDRPEISLRARPGSPVHQALRPRSSASRAPVEPMAASRRPRSRIAPAPDRAATPDRYEPRPTQHRRPSIGSVDPARTTRRRG